MQDQTIEETYAIMETCATLECIRDNLAQLSDSDNKTELVRWLKVSTDMFKSVVCDGCTVVEEADAKED